MSQSNKEIISIIITCILISFPQMLNAQKISVGKEFHQANESITISYSELPSEIFNWIAVSKKNSSNDKYIIWYDTNYKEEGIFSFDNLEVGEYEARLYLNWPSEGYNISEKESFIVKIDSTNLGPEKGLIENSNLDELAYIGMFMSADEIVAEMKIKNSAIDLARLEAAFKRKILELIQNNDMYKSLDLGKITTMEVKSIADEYEKLEEPTKRSIFYGPLLDHLTYLFDDNHKDFVKDRLIKIFYSNELRKFFTDIYTRDEILGMYEKFTEAVVVKDFWRAQLGYRNNLKQMVCNNYSIYCFNDDLNSEELESINTLRVKEGAMFSSFGIQPPLFPPSVSEINVVCKDSE